MCGITGAVWLNPDLAVEKSVLKKMTDVLRHRGPDDQGQYESQFQLKAPSADMPGAALGFRRLSIIDLEGGRQPISNENGRIWVVFNGEIYNYKELRHRLEGAGHTFRTQSDSETIVHLYEDEGLDCFRHLNGMFAIAIWDSVERRLVLGRDRLGQKPLVYRHQQGRLSFASELKSLLQIPGAPREIDPCAIDEYLTYQYIPYPNTIFRGIKKVPPGCLAVYQDDRLEVKPYWRPDFNTQQPLSWPDAITQVRETLESSVALRMQSDVPLGAFLSGGVDSSLIAALMQKQADQPIKTFSIGFSVAEYDETKYARMVAQHLGTEHHEFQVTPDAVGVLEKLIWHYDEPFADSSAIPTWYVSEMTRQHVTVSLSGDGGDELFLGYPRYRAVQLGSWLDRLGPLRWVLGAKLWQSIPAGTRQKSKLRQFKRFSEALRADPRRRYLDWISIFNENRRGQLYHDDFIAQLTESDPAGFLNTAWSRAKNRDQATTASLADLMTYLPCDLMTKVDIASMAHGLECRQPFLDYRLVELAASMPVELKYRRGAGKRILRKAFGGLLPKEIWNRKKMGFGVPLDRWFRNELKELAHDILLDEKAKNRGYFRSEAVSDLLEEHQNRHFDHSYRLWALLILELWMRQWCDNGN